MKRITAILSLFLLMLSCRKETDTILPSITVVEPSEGSQYNVLDTINVHVVLADNEILKDVEVRLVDQQLTPVMPSMRQELNSKQADITFQYWLGDIRLLSGNYYLEVKASDGINTKRMFRGVNITEVPFEYKGFYAVLQPQASQYQLFRADTFTQPVLWKSESSDFCDMAVNSWWQQVYVNGLYYGPLKTFSIDGNNPDWSKNAVVGAVPFWGPMQANGKYTWVNFKAKGQYQQLSSSGSQYFAASVNSNYAFESALQVGNRLFTEQKEISSPNRVIVVHSLSGAALQQSPVNIDIVEMIAKDNDNLYLFGNENGQGHLLIYDYTTNGTWEPIGLPAGTVISAGMFNDGSLIFSMSNGNVYKFTYNPISVSVYKGGTFTTLIRVNKAGNNSWLSLEGNTVKQYSGSMSTDYTYTFPGTPLDIEILYNR